jgi:phosphatidate cytidylyltransferase
VPDGSVRPDAGAPPAPSAPDGSPEPDAGKPARSGRNLPVAAGVGVLLGGLAVLSLFTVKATFMILMGAAAVTGLRELVRALGQRHVRLPVVPIAAGGAAMWVCEYWWNDRAVLAAAALTTVAIFAWRLPGGPDGYLRDVMAGLFALAYLPFLAVFIVALLAPADGARRVVIFIVLNVCVDVGGYFAGSLLGRHPMARLISPSKTWEGLAGSVLICLAAGAILIPWLLHGHVWQGIVTGVAAAAAAVVGDLAESSIKRDLKIKDMGTLLPGHGGVLDRIDSHLVAAPVTWLLLAVFISVPR